MFLILHFFCAFVRCLKARIKWGGVKNPVRYVRFDVCSKKQQVVVILAFMIHTSALLIFLKRTSTPNTLIDFNTCTIF